MEIWKIYHVFLTVWMCSYSTNAQNIRYFSNSRGDDRPVTVLKSVSNGYPNLNANSREPFRNVNNLSTSAGVNSLTLGSSFNAKLFEIMSLDAQTRNLVFSPISLQSLLGFIFAMSDGKLYEELNVLLELPNNGAYVSKIFENILQKSTLNTPPTTLIMANKLYYDYRFGTVDPNVRFLAKNSFASELEQMDFGDPLRAASIMNSWVSERTRNLIQNIVTPSSIRGDTSAMLLNSIYFKSDWLIKFGIYDTEVQPFYVTRDRQVPVDMMYNEDVFRFGDFTEDLQASVVELPYNATDLTMLLILPKDVEGLTQLERKLRYYDLETISHKLKRETVTVKMPKFKIEFETDMIETLQKMGLNALFNKVGVIKLFKNQQKPLNVDQFKHKAFINVNEAGTEAAAVSVAKYVPLSIPLNMKYFTADHPFVFAVRNGNTTLFMGHVVQI